MPDPIEGQNYEEIGPNTEVPGDYDNENGNGYPKSNQEILAEAIDCVFREMYRLHREQESAYGSIDNIRKKLVDNQGKMSRCTEYLKKFTSNSDMEYTMMLAALFIAAQKKPELWGFIYGNEK